MEKIIRPNALSKLLSISIPTLYRKMKEPDFPDKIRLSKQAIGFRESEIDEWLNSQREPSHIEII